MATPAIKLYLNLHTTGNFSFYEIKLAIIFKNTPLNNLFCSSITQKCANVRKVTALCVATHQFGQPDV